MDLPGLKKKQPESRYEERKNIVMVATGAFLDAHLDAVARIKNELWAIQDSGVRYNIARVLIMDLAMVAARIDPVTAVGIIESSSTGFPQFFDANVEQIIEAIEKAAEPKVNSPLEVVNTEKTVNVGPIQLVKRERPRELTTSSGENVAW
jgi:hypothetical protein